MNGSKAVVGFVDSWKILYRGRTFFSVFLIGAMVANVVVFLWVLLGGPVDALKHPAALYGCPPLTPGMVPSTRPFTAPTTGPAAAFVEAFSDEAMPTQEEINSAQQWRQIFTVIMFVAGILAILGAVFMTACALLGVMVLVAGGLPGSGFATSAFFYVVGAALWLLLPWEEALSGTVYMPVGVLNFQDLFYAYRGSNPGDWLTFASLIVKYVVYPVVLILLAVMYLGRTSQANSVVVAATRPETPELGR